MSTPTPRIKNYINEFKGCLPKKNSKIWDIGSKGGRGSGLNPNFFDILIGTNTVGGGGQKVFETKKMQ